MASRYKLDTVSCVCRCASDRTHKDIKRTNKFERQKKIPTRNNRQKTLNMKTS